MKWLQIVLKVEQTDWRDDAGIMRILVTEQTLRFVIAVTDTEWVFVCGLQPWSRRPLGLQLFRLFTEPEQLPTIQSCRVTGRTWALSVQTKRRTRSEV